MYSFLFSLVTSIFRPLGLRSTVTVSPNLSSSVEKVISKTFSMSLFLEQLVYTALQMKIYLTVSNLDFGGSQHQPLPCPPRILFSVVSFCRRRR